MISLIHVNKAAWDGMSDRLRGDFDAAVTDYLRRSREEVDEKTLWTAIAAAIADQTAGVMLVIGLKDGNFAGYAIFRVETGNEVTGGILHCWQLYAKPGVSSLPELYAAAESYIVLAARKFGIKRMTLQTRRYGPAFDRLYGRIGFKPYAMSYQAPIPPYTKEEILKVLEGNNEVREGHRPTVDTAVQGKRRKRRRHKRTAPIPVADGG